MKKKIFGNMLLATGMIMAMSGSVNALSEPYYENDVTPPWGRISIVGATEVDNVNYVDRQKVDVQLYAADDMCPADWIRFHISTSEILDTEAITEWIFYVPGETIEVELPNVSSTNTIYAVFKDCNGNTSLIFDKSIASQTIVYDVNAADAEMPTGLASQRTYGAPFVVTNQTPKREGYYFKGWATDPSYTEANYRQGDVIAACDTLGDGATGTLYAVWTRDFDELPLLADVAEIGDYVNYPVYYDNVYTSGTSYKSTYKGWRVLSKGIDIDGEEMAGTVNLVSAGVPLTYYHTSPSTTSVKALAIDFLTTGFDPSANYKFRKTGFNPYQTLSEVFDNKFTAYGRNETVTYPTYSSNTVTGTITDYGTKVRAMTAQDIIKITGDTTFSSSVSLTKEEYQNLFIIGANYWLASAANASDLWLVRNDGDVDDGYRFECGVRPVVSLWSNVHVTGTDMLGAWNIEISTQN